VGVREPLSRERVLSAAVALADKEGIAALTMRRLAADLGVEAMSLYYHLPGKDGLLDGLAGTVLAEIAAAIDDGESDRTRRSRDWRARLRRWFLAARTVMLRHPWAPALIGTRRRVPDGMYQYYERILGTLFEAGFSHRIAHRALHAFGSMPLGFVQELLMPTPADGADADAELSDEALVAMPNMAAMVAAELHDVADPMLGWCDGQAEFEFTLDLLLDGLERFRNR
jgi:AcrR family transcriptional regulator